MVPGGPPAELCFPSTKDGVSSPQAEEQVLFPNNQPPPGTGGKQYGKGNVAKLQFLATLVFLARLFP